MTESAKNDPTTCEVCGLNPATITVRRVTAGDEEELKLCPDCARDKGLDTKTTPGSGDPATLLFQGMAEAEGSDGVCPGCGLTFSRFRETGRLGCARCYDTFASDLESLVRRVQGAVRHRGKTPGRVQGGDEVAARLRRLNDELERAVKAEDYERAAELRDQIAAQELTYSPSSAATEEESS